VELPLEHAAPPAVPESARLALARRSVKANRRRVREAWGPGLTGLEWHTRTRVHVQVIPAQERDERRVLLLLDGSTLVRVGWPTGRPAAAFDPVGWALWEARYLWAIATAKLDRQELAQHKDNQPSRQLRLRPIGLERGKRRR